MHPSTVAILKYFTHAHLPQHLSKVSAPFANLARIIADSLEGPEATVALRKLLESKDAAVRAAVTMTHDATVREGVARAIHEGAPKRLHNPT